MRPISYLRAAEPATAVESLQPASTHALAGGTTLIDLMKLNVLTPKRVVDINPLPWDEIVPMGEGVRLGALARNSDVAFHPWIAERFPLVRQALLAGASPQLRNMATVGGNLIQRTRCPYFRDAAEPRCNKRSPGSGCAAREGVHRMHAVLGTSSACIAAHPSDFCVALMALDATVQVVGPAGDRQVSIADFHLLPEGHPERETVLRPAELIRAVDIPPLPYAWRASYAKVRDRSSFAFALASAGVMLDLERGVIRQARVAFGGIGTKPWRAREAEDVLRGRPAEAVTFQLASQAALRDAAPLPGNAFKVELARRILVRTLTLTAARGEEKRP